MDSFVVNYSRQLYLRVFDKRDILIYMIFMKLLY